MAKKKILVVEDHNDTRALMALVLGQLGYDIAEAATGLDAIDQARAVHPDLIFMDLGLPGITGDEAIARLKADPSTREIPVIVNTAFHKSSVFVERAIAFGAVEILHKPLSFTALRGIVERHLLSSGKSLEIHDNSQPFELPNLVL
jgi:CheY-like chemotaxis protein